MADDVYSTCSVFVHSKLPLFTVSVDAKENTIHFCAMYINEHFLIIIMHT